ncbi:MAG TPA: hypothetical protein P5160_08290 [Candidatus Omnitrophota bacterium]|jgi:inorganic pyrophosphatase/exopolyphosphatase|nr:hypothetical protein [Candidatus Omnitrophota bacterium]
MDKKFIRVYQKFDFADIREHTMIYGDLSASCSHCNALDIKFGVPICPECRTDFKYIAFRNVKHHLPKMDKMYAENTKVILIDFEDYQRALAEIKAEEFWK